MGDAQALYNEVVQGELRDVLVRLAEAAEDRRVLVRLFVRDRGLQSAPWEAICKPGTTEGFWGTDPKILVARGVTSSDPWEPREVRGAVRVLGIAPGSDDRALHALREALAPSIDAGEVEWLDEAKADVRRMDRPAAMRIFDGILHYARTGGGDIEPLHGEMSGSFRLRIGSYRVLFSRHDDAMRIYGVRHRSEAYR